MAGRHYLTKADLNALYSATYSLPRPRGWKAVADRRALLARRSGRLLQLRRRYRHGLQAGFVPRADPLAARLLAGVKPKQDIETEEEKPWVLKDLRKTCATYYDEHMPESSVEIHGHSVGGVTYRHYALRDPLAFKAVLSLPQPTAFTALVHGFDGECPCCRRRFPQALDLASAVPPRISRGGVAAAARPTRNRPVSKSPKLVHPTSIRLNVKAF